jgi:hypothetical protein
MVENVKKSQLQSNTEERLKYLRDLNNQIKFAEEAGADSIRAIKEEIEILDFKRADLMQHNLNIEQKIREGEAALLIIDKQLV